MQKKYVSFFTKNLPLPLYPFPDLLLRQIVKLSLRFVLNKSRAIYVYFINLLRIFIFSCCFKKLICLIVSVLQDI